MTKFIINADDFGFSEAVNYGIVSAYKNGVVTSTTLMANMPGADHAIELAKEHKGLGCGVHMTLTCGKPLGNYKTIVDDNGNFYRRMTPEIAKNIDLDEVYEEWCMQIDKVKNAGIEITHLDSHHHIHTTKELKEVVERIIQKYKLPVRGGFEYEFNAGKSVTCIDSFYKENVEEDYFENNSETLKEYDVIDLMCHPAYVDEILLKGTSYAMDRVKEYTILTSDKVKKDLDKNGFELITYKEIN